MDAEHRHELKSNELADWIAHIPQYIKEHPNQIIGVVIILIALVTWPLFSNMRSQSGIREQASVVSMIDMAEQARISRANPEQTEVAPEPLTVVAQSLQDEAGKTDNPNLAAMALIKRGNALRADLHFADEVTDELISTRVSDARTAYEKAAELAEMPAVKGLAQLGLGLCAEETREFDKAREVYQNILDDKAYESTVVPVEAQRRLDALADNSIEVIFAPAPPEAEEAAGAPAEGVQPIEPTIEAPQAPVTEQPRETPAADAPADEPAAQEPAAEAPAQPQ